MSSPSLPLPPAPLVERLRRGDAAALLELAHATHARALAAVRAARWAEDAEGLLLDAYVALYFRRAEAPDVGVEAWALAEVLGFCEQRATGRAAARPTARATARAWSAVRSAVRAASRRALCAVAPSRAGSRGVCHHATPAVGGSAT